MSADVHNSTAITPPISGSDDLVVLGSSTTAAVFQIPQKHLRSVVTVAAEGADVYVAFTKDSTLTLSGSAVTTLSSNAISSHGTGEAVVIPAGQERNFDLSKLPRLAGDEEWYLAHVEAASGGFLRYTRSSGPAAS